MSKLELIIRVAIAIIGYSIAVYYVVRALIVASSMDRDKVPYVPASLSLVKKIGELMKLEKGDRFIDIGSGDGRVLFVLGKHYPDVQFTGVELRKHLVWWSRLHVGIRKLKNVEIVQGDALKYDVSGYNKVFMYMMPGFLKQVIGKLEKDLQKGALVASLSFEYPKDFVAKHKNDVETTTLKGIFRDKLHLWKV